MIFHINSLKENYIEAEMNYRVFLNEVGIVGKLMCNIQGLSEK